MNDPEIYYDAPSDTLLITVSKEPNTESYEPVPGVIVTVGHDGDLTAIEFMGKVRPRFASLIDYFVDEARQQARRAS